MMIQETLLLLVKLSMAAADITANVSDHSAKENIIGEHEHEVEPEFSIQPKHKMLANLTNDEHNRTF